MSERRSDQIVENHKFYHKYDKKIWFSPYCSRLNVNEAYENRLETEMSILYGIFNMSKFNAHFQSVQL